MRQEAEARLAKLESTTDGFPAEVRRLMHELSVHQIELEMQNEQLRQTQLSLETARSRYFDLYEQAPIAYFMVSLGGRILECNRRAAQLLGGYPSQLVGRNFDDFLAAQEISSFQELRDLLVGTGQAQQIELVMRRADGSAFWGELQMNQTQLDDQETVTRIATTDITERKRMEATAARLVAIVTWNDQAIFSQGLAGEITSWNPGAEKLFGYRAGDVIGSPLSILFPPERAEEEKSDLHRVRRGERMAYESVRRRQDGTLIPVFISISPIFDDHGGITGASHIARDITDEMAARERLSGLLEELQKSEASLKQADQRKDEFIATLAHELRNPLAPIRNAAAVLRYAPRLDPKVEWCRDVIDRQVSHMATLLDDLLDVSRITRNMIHLHRAPMELFSAIAQAIEINRPLIDARGHALRVQVPPRPIEVDGDMTRLTQVFGNLLNNAAKYTDPGGTIELKVEQQGEEVEVRVKDSGIGIAAVYLPHVFDLFSQVDSSGERGQGGLGIGLSLVKALVEMHDGTIQVQSEGLGHGSEFVVRMPTVRPAKVTTRATERSLGSLAGSAAKRRLLVVDDNVDSADSLALMLTLQGYEVRTARDGEEAFDLARDYRPDVAILDVGLPKLNGHEVGRRIREQPWGQNMFLIACTGWGQAEDQQRSEEAGFDSHLVKPVHLDTLLKLLSSRSPSAER